MILLLGVENVESSCCKTKTLALSAQGQCPESFRLPVGGFYAKPNQKLGNSKPLCPNTPVAAESEEAHCGPDRSPRARRVHGL